MSDVKLLALAQGLYEREELIHGEARLGHDLPVELKRLTQTLAGFECRRLPARRAREVRRHDTDDVGQTPDRGGLRAEHGRAQEGLEPCR